MNIIQIGSTQIFKTLIEKFFTIIILKKFLQKTKIGFLILLIHSKISLFSHIMIKMESITKHIEMNHISLVYLGFTKNLRNLQEEIWFSIMVKKRLI